MKHAFQNLNIALKKKAGRNRFDILDEGVETLSSSYGYVKEMYDNFKIKYTSLGDSIYRAGGHGHSEGDTKKIEDLIDNVLQVSLTDLDRAKDWKALLSIVEKGYSSKLKKEQNEVNKYLEKLQTSVEMSLGFSKDSFEKF